MRATLTISLPLMLRRDVSRVAKAQRVSESEFVRRAVQKQLWADAFEETLRPVIIAVLQTFEGKMVRLGYGQPSQLGKDVPVKSGRGNYCLSNNTSIRKNDLFQQAPSPKWQARELLNYRQAKKCGK